MSETLASSQYLVRGDLAVAHQSLIERLCDYNIPHLIGEGEGEASLEKQAKVTRLYAPLWKGVGRIELEPVDSTQTLVRFCLPGYPDDAETERYEQEIRMALPPPAAAIRLIDVEGDRARALAYLGRKLNEFRLQRLREIQNVLVNSLGLLSLYGLPIEGNRFLYGEGPKPEQQQSAGRNTDRDIPKRDQPLRGDIQLMLRLWQSGHTAKEIALRTSRTEKTILNRLTLLRKSLGEKLVPRRK